MNMNLKKVLSLVAALAMSTSCFTALADEVAEEVAAEETVVEEVATEEAAAEEVAEEAAEEEAVEEIAETEEVEAVAVKGITDIDGNAYKVAIEELIALGVVNGYTDGTFKPDNEITRAEVTKMVVAAMGPSYTAAAESAKGTTGFEDVDSKNHWASGYIATGVAQAFINGMGDGTFSPDTNVTYAQIVKMLAAVLGYTPAAEANGGYPNGYIQTANSIGLTEGVSGVSADTAVTRGQVAQLISNAVDTPIVAVTSWTTDIYGKPVAETEIKDGKGDSEEYWTLLTENHDVYKVRGRVIKTYAQGNVDRDEVEFNIEYADNYDGEVYNKRKDGSETQEVVLFGNTNANELLFTYAEALIKLNDDDDAELLSITAYGKNDIVELAADDFDDFDYIGEVIDDKNDTDASNDVKATANTIDFTISSTSSKTKTYKLSDKVEAYVNGIEVPYITAINTYVLNNTIGKVTLIDTPMDGNSSKDGKYDYIMIDYKKWAVVDSTSSSSTVDKIYFDEFEAGFVANVSIDNDDEDLLVSYFEDGEEAGFDAIKEGSVVLVTYDISGPVKESDFLKFEITNTIVEGQVASKSKEDGKNVYVVDGTEYKSCADDTQGELTVGNDYALYIDAAGRIVKYDETASSKNYAIIDRVYTDINAGEDKVRIIKADGTRASYIVKDAATSTLAAQIAYTDDKKDGNLEALENRVISYKLNSSEEIHTIAVLSTTIEKDEYNENSVKVSAAKMNDATQIVDLTDIATVAPSGSTYTVSTSTYSVSDIAAATLASFIDGEEYTVIAADKNTDGYYKFVVIVDGNASIGVSTGFAVIDSVSTATYEADGSTRTTITVFSADSKGDKLELFLDEDITNENAIKALKRGDVVVYGTDGDGVVTDCEILFTDINENASAMTYADAFGIINTAEKDFNVYDKNDLNDDGDYEDTVNGEDETKLVKSVDNDPKGKLGNFYFKTGVDKWDTSDLTTSNGYARVGFGAIVDKNGSTITIASIKKAANAITTASKDKDGNPITIAKGNYCSENADMAEFSIDSDVNVYVYDYNYKNSSTSGRLSAGASGSIIKTSVANSLVYEDAKGNDVYDWTTIEGEEVNANYAYFKVVDGDITDILVILPKE